MNNLSKQIVKDLIIAESGRIVELLDKIPTKEINSEYYSSEYAELKAELKAKMHELRRDTVRLTKMLNGRTGNVD